MSNQYQQNHVRSSMPEVQHAMPDQNQFNSRTSGRGLQGYHRRPGNNSRTGRPGPNDPLPMAMQGLQLTESHKASQRNIAQPAPAFANDEHAFPRLGHTMLGTTGPLPPPANSANAITGTTTSMLDLNQKMRDMIVKNQAVDALPPNHGQPAPTAMQPPFRNHRPQRRDNQKTRQQKLLDDQQLLTSMSSGGRSYTPPHVQPQSMDTPPHLRAQLSHPPDPNLMSRPSPRNRQLYNPHQSGHSQGLSLGHVQPDDIGQMQYLEPIIQAEVAKVEMTSEEFNVKEGLRAQLEQVCTLAIANHEKKDHPGFDPSSVRLECYGSLATTFGTKNSDMDLMLCSPQSTIDALGVDSLPRLIEKALLESKYGARLLTRTRVSIIKFCETPSPDLYQKLLEARAAWENEDEQQTSQRNTVKDGEQPQSESATSEGQQPEAAPSRAVVTNDRGVLERKVEATDSQDKTIEHAAEGVQKRANSPGQAGVKSPPLTSGTKPPASEEAPRDLECDDPSLVSKSDQERVRLYRIAMREDWYEPQERRIIVSFIEAYEASMSNTQFPPQPSRLSTARAALANLPNVLRRYRPRNTSPLDFPKTGVGIQCDINFSNDLGLHNSALLRCYSLCDARVRPMVLFIKAWAKRRHINSAYESTLGSYGYVLMVLHYLINIADPPVLPNLQHWNLSPDPNHINGPRMVDNHLVHFFRDERALSQLEPTGQGSNNKAPLAALIRGFFIYYGSNNYPSFQWTQHVISLRTFPGGILTKHSKGWTAAKTEHVDIAGDGPHPSSTSSTVSPSTNTATTILSPGPPPPLPFPYTAPAPAAPSPSSTKEVRQRYLIAIEDPFETSHNVGRTVSHDGIVAIRDEMRRAHRLIMAHSLNRMPGREEEGLMDEAPERGNLLYRYFGPNPKRGKGKGKGKGKDGSGGSASKQDAELQKQKEKSRGKDDGVGQSAPGAPT